MFDSFLSGVFLGFGVSVPFGPVNILILTYALKAFKNSIAVGLGAFSIDMLYLFFASIWAFKFLRQCHFYAFFGDFWFLFFNLYGVFDAKKKERKLKFRA